MRLAPLALAFAAFAALPAWAAAQEAVSIPVIDRGDGDMRAAVDIVFRASAIAGEVDSGLDLDYSDIFGAGSGFGLEGAFLWPTGHVDVGGYLALNWDLYRGESWSDAVGDTLKPDTMNVRSFLFGGKGILSVDKNFYVEFHAGFGIVSYEKVDGVLTISGAPLDITVFKASSSFAFDIGARVGVLLGHLFGELGFGLRSQGPPKEGDLAFDSLPASVASFEIAFGLRF